METSREDVGIAIRSAFLRTDTKQRFSLFFLILFSIILIFVEKIETKPLNYVRSFVKDGIYRVSQIASYPAKSFGTSLNFIEKHVNLNEEYKVLEKENQILKNKIVQDEFLNLENVQLKKLIDEQVSSHNNLVSSRVIIDKQSPYLNSFIINSGSNKNIKNGMTVLDGKYFIGRIVDVNFFSSRVLLVSDLNSHIPVIIEPEGIHAILYGHGSSNATLEYLPENHKIKKNDKVYTSGKEGVFEPGVPIGKVLINDGQIEVLLFSDLDQITFVNVDLADVELR